MGAFQEIPEDYKSLDPLILDEILFAIGLADKAPLKGSTQTAKIDWQVTGEKNGVKMYWAQTPGTANYFFKGVGVIAAPVKVVEEAMREIQNMRIIDPMCKLARSIKHYDKDHHIYYAQFKLPPFISDRDFVWYSIDCKLPDGTFVTTGKSMVTKDCPADSGHVRGEIRASGYVVEPIADKPDACTLYYIVQTDPKGWLPAWVVNWVAASQSYNPGVIKEKTQYFIDLAKKSEAARKHEDEWKKKQEEKKAASPAAAAAESGKKDEAPKKEEAASASSSSSSSSTSAPQVPAAGPPAAAATPAPAATPQAAPSS